MPRGFVVLVQDSNGGARETGQELDVLHPELLDPDVEGLAQLAPIIDGNDLRRFVSCVKSIRVAGMPAVSSWV